MREIIAVEYDRVSTRDKQNIEMQEKANRDYAERNGFRITKQYKDVGQSGKKESRPAFDELLKDMRAGLFNTIIVYKLDRIGRSLSHLVRLFEEFDKKGINFISVTQNINTTTPEGKMFRNMLMVLSEYERELIVGRINSGLDNAREEGKKLGRPKGATDKVRRVKSGYYLYWNKRKNKQSIPLTFSQNTQEQKDISQNKQSGDYST